MSVTQKIPRPALPPVRFSSAVDSAFRIELRQAADQYLASRSEHRFGNAGHYLKGILLAMLATAAYWFAVSAGQLWHFVPAYFAFLFLAMLLAMNVLHDAAHYAYVRQPWLNRLLMRLVSIPVGIDPAFWTIRHVHFHHTYANIEGYDLDTEPNPVLRQTPYQRWLPHFRFQHVYWPLVAAISLPYLCWYSDWADRCGATKVAATGKRDGWPGWPLFLSLKVLHLTVAVLLPVWFLRDSGIGWGQIVLCYVLGQMLASCFLVAMILGTHWAEVDFFQPPATGVMPHTWHEHTFRTACDWTPAPRSLDHLMGGLNYHLTHHLFPTWSHRHYRPLAKIVAQVAARHQLNYRNLTYSQLWTSQQAFLRAMGRQP